MRPTVRQFSRVHRPDTELCERVGASEGEARGADNRELELRKFEPGVASSEVSRIPGDKRHRTPLQSATRSKRGDKIEHWVKYQSCKVMPAPIKY